MSSPRSKASLIRTVILVACLPLFVFFLWRADLTKVWQDVQRLEWAFLLVFAISFIRPTARAIAWSLCVPRSHPVSWLTTWKAYVAGDTFGSIIPLGIVVSEPTKAALLGEAIPLSDGVSSLAIENMIYGFGTVIFVMSGTLALFLSFEMPPPLKLACIVVLAGMNAGLLLAYLLLSKRWRIISAGVKWAVEHGIGGKKLASKTGSVRDFEDQLFDSFAGLSWRLLVILALEICFHLAGVAEVYATLAFIDSSAPPLLTAFVLESVNRVINIAFKFVPLRAGVDEAGSGMFAALLMLNFSSGVTLAVIRKARILCWTAVGIAVLLFARMRTNASKTAPGEAH